MTCDGKRGMARNMPCSLPTSGQNKAWVVVEFANQQPSIGGKKHAMFLAYIWSEQGMGSC